MSKSVNRKRLEAMLEGAPVIEQLEAWLEERLGKPGKANQIAQLKRNVRAANPKPGETSPDVGAADRLSVLKVLQNNHGTVYQRPGGNITYQDIETAIGNLNTEAQRNNAWLDYLEPMWVKDHSLIALIADEFDLDSDDIDNIFDAAVTHRLSKGVS